MPPSWLKKHGVTGSPTELREFARATQDAWVMRTGTIITDKLSEAQANEVANALNEDAQLALLEQFMPNYKDIVNQEAVKLKQELKAASDKASLLREWAKEYGEK